MEVISPALRAPRRSITPILATSVGGMALVVVGLSLAYIAYATPALSMILPTGHPTAGQMAAGMAIWALALVAPAGCVLAGANRLARLLVSARHQMPRQSTTQRALADIPDVVVATGLHLSDGRTVPDVVLGPFGAVVVRDLPAAPLIRIQDGRWSVRAQRGWIALDSPLERTVRDAERVRRWLAHDDADFVVKVYSVVVGTDPRVQRTPACAVVAPDQLAAWIRALPAQRSLTSGRRERMIAMVRESAGAPPKGPDARDW
jgi:hypothetical protein